MKQIDIKELNENFIEAIGKEWMLVTAGTEKSFNTMTASWGGIGFLWGKPVVFTFIRPERYTYDFIEDNEYYTQAFLGEENKAILNFCGSKSGKDTDKVAETGLIPVVTPKGNITFEQARLTLECKKLYKTMLREGDVLNDSVLQWYSPKKGNFHAVYVAEITAVWVKE